MSDNARWNEIKDVYPVGMKVKVAVTRHAPFGFFAKIPDVEYDGLIQITDCKDDGRMTVAEFPPVGAAIDVVVLGFADTRKQIWLGMKPSQLRSESKEIR